MDRRVVQLPHRVGHGPVMRVDDMRAHVVVTGEVHLHHPVVGQRSQIPYRVKLVVDRRDVNVVDVKQEAAVRLLGHAGQELRL